MTARGIFEFYLYQCMGELQLVDKIKPTERFNAKSVLNTIIAMTASNKLPNSAEKCRKLLNAADKCDCKDIYEMYALLSNEIHGRPWNGEGVKVYAANMDKAYLCLINFIADEFKFPVEIVND